MSKKVTDVSPLQTESRTVLAGLKLSKSGKVGNERMKNKCESRKFVIECSDLALSKIVMQLHFIT